MCVCVHNTWGLLKFNGGTVTFCVRNFSSLSIEPLYPFHPPISCLQKKKEDSPEGPEYMDRRIGGGEGVENDIGM